MAGRRPPSCPGRRRRDQAPDRSGGCQTRLTMDRHVSTLLGSLSHPASAARRAPLVFGPGQLEACLQHLDARQGARGRPSSTGLPISPRRRRKTGRHPFAGRKLPSGLKSGAARRSAAAAAGRPLRGVHLLQKDVTGQVGLLGGAALRERGVQDGRDGRRDGAQAGGLPGRADRQPPAGRSGGPGRGSVRG